MRQGDFDVTICIYLFFVEVVGIFSARSDENPSMALDERDNHREIKDHDEPESYRKIVETERMRNVK